MVLVLIIRCLVDGKEGALGNARKYFCKKNLQITKKALTLHSLNEKISTNGTGEVGEWLKPAVC